MARRRRRSYDFTSGKSGSGSYTFKTTQKPVDLAPPTLTMTQALTLQAAKKKGHSESFWDRIKSGGGHVLHPIEWTFDKILRPHYGFVGAIRAEKKAQREGDSFWEQFKAGLGGFERGFTGEEKGGYGRVLKESGTLKGHGRLRGVAGFALDVGLDPTTYLSGGATIAARSGSHAAAIAAGRRSIEDAPGKVFVKALKTGDKKLEQQAFDKAVGDANVLSKAGENYKYRAALTNEQVRHKMVAQSKDGWGDEIAELKAYQELDTLRSMAKAEEKRVEKFLPHYRLGGKKITPTAIGGKTIGTADHAILGSKRLITTGKPIVPSMPKIDSLVGKFGIGGKSAEQFRDAFIRDKGYSPETRAASMVQRHSAELLTDRQLTMARDRLEGVSKSLGAKRQREVLHLFEKPRKGWRAVEKRGEAFALNPRYVTHLVEQGLLKPKEADFVQGYHDVVEQLFHNEKAFGSTAAHFSAKGRMYVPHMADFGAGSKSDAMRKLTTKAGFERARSHRELSLHQLVEASETGKLPKGVVGDPYEVLVGRIRASARRQSELAMLGAFAKVGGVSSKLVDRKAIDDIVFEQNDISLAIAEMAKGHKADVVKRDAQHRKDMAALTKKGAPKAQLAARQKKYVDEIEAANRRAEKDLNGFEAKLKQLAKQEKVLRAGKKNPAYKKDMTITDALDENGHKIAFSGDLAEAVQKVHRVVTGEDDIIRDFDTGWRKVTAAWKLLVTTINPGYRMRNTLSDLWGMFISGANGYEIGKYTMVAAKVMRDAKNGDAKALAVIETAYRHGILSGMYAGDIQAVTRFLKYSGSKRSLVAGMSKGNANDARKLFVKVAQDMNRNAENWIRLSHLLWQMKYEYRTGFATKGTSVAEAAFRVKRAHFDYEDLTKFEQKKLKGVMPFYTWTRKNIPFQIKALIERPGKFMAFPKAVQEAEYASGGDKGTPLPDYIPDAFGFQIPFGKNNYLIPQIGAADLQALESPGAAQKRLLGLLHPGIKAPMELLLNKSSFTGAPIVSDTHTRSPITPFAAGLLRLLPGSDVGGTSRMGPGGKRLSGPGADPKLVYALGNLGPLASLLLTRSGGIKAKQTPVAPWWSYGAGLTVQHVDPELQAMYAEMEATAAGRKKLSELRDEGIIPPAKRRTGPKSRYMTRRIIEEVGRR